MNHFQLYFIAFLILFGAHANGQDELTIRYGIRAGMNASNTSTGVGIGPSYKDPTAKVGASIGILVNIPIDYRFSLQPELLYANEGSTQTGLPSNASSSDYTRLFVMRLNYVSLPVMLQFADEESGLYIEAGPQLSWIATAKLTSTVDLTNIAPFQPFKGYFNSRVLSASVGAGINFLNGIGVGARYNMGLTRATEDFRSMKTNSLYVGAHFKF